MDAVRPCLPLPGIGRAYVSSGSNGGPDLYFINETASVNGSHVVSPGAFKQRIIGAIWQACAEREWTFGLCWGGPLCKPSGMHVSINTGDMSEDARPFTADGTSAVSLCRAYAVAKEASDA